MSDTPSTYAGGRRRDGRNTATGFAGNLLALIAFALVFGDGQTDPPQPEIVDDHT